MKHVYKILIFIFVTFWLKTVFDETKFNLFDIIDEFRNAKIDDTKTFESSESCKCRSDKILLKNKGDYIDVQSIIGNNSRTIYTLTYSQYDQLKYSNCDLYNNLRRGPKQKVIGYSLYGKQKRYYKHLKTIALLTQKIYPNWVMRIHYDESIDKSIICELECLQNEDGNYLDNVDFCKIDRIPNGASSKTWDATKMHAMTWRWLPIGDAFVDYFMSRDTDSWPTQRELDSVNVWLNSSTKFHIMRDHPQHNMHILGGLWGFANKIDRALANHIFFLISYNKVSERYNLKERNKKGLDQSLLGDHIFKYSKESSTVHDSFFCKKYGGNPFPTRRLEGLCFVSCSNCCDMVKNINYTEIWNYECPNECRPDNHKDWREC